MMKMPHKRNWRWSTYLRLLFAGWRPNRNVWDRLRLPRSFSAFPEAKRVLAEFGDLKFEDPSERIVLDPSVGDEIAEEIRAYEAKLGYLLYPVGILDGGDTLYLLIDERGIVYTLSDELEPFAMSFERAVEYLARHSGGRDEELQSVGMLGKVWRLS